MIEKAVALGFGAGDAVVASKVPGMGPGGIPWPVYYEAAGLAIGFFGNKVGVSEATRDTVLIAALAQLGARGARVAMAGKLMLGPRAWGGAEGGYASGDMTSPGDAGTGGAPAMSAGRPRLLAGARAQGGGFSVWPVSQEAPGVAG